MGVNQSSAVTAEECDQYSLHYKELYANLIPPHPTSDDKTLHSLTFKDRFISLLGGPSSELGKRLYCFLFEDKSIECEGSFVLAMSKLLSSINEACFLSNLFLGSDNNFEGDIQELVHASAVCALQCGSTYYNDDVSMSHPLLSSITLSIMQYCCNPTGKSELCHQWFTLHSPHLLTGLRQWLLSILTPIAARKVTYHLPTVNYEDKQRQFDLHLLVWVLSSTLPTLYMSARSKVTEFEDLPVDGTWTCLYSSKNHGFSMNRFKHHCFDYKKPSILTLDCYKGSDDQRYSYALAMDSEWRDGTYFYGGENFFLVQLTPMFLLLKRGAKLVSLNEKQRGFPCGLRVMASDKYNYCLLEVKASLEQARINEGDWMQVQLMEVWGCGGVEAVETQKRVKEWESKEVLRRRKINRSDTWEDSPDRALLEMGGIKTSRPTEQSN